MPKPYLGCTSSLRSVNVQVLHYMVLHICYVVEKELPSGKEKMLFGEYDI